MKLKNERILYVDPYTNHIEECEEAKELMIDLTEVEVRKWAHSGNIDLLIGHRSVPIYYCPFCGKRMK